MLDVFRVGTRIRRFDRMGEYLRNSAGYPSWRNSLRWRVHILGGYVQKSDGVRVNGRIGSFPTMRTSPD